MLVSREDSLGARLEALENPPLTADSTRVVEDFAEGRTEGRENSRPSEARTAGEALSGDRPSELAFRSSVHSSCSPLHVDDESGRSGGAAAKAIEDSLKEGLKLPLSLSSLVKARSRGEGRNAWQESLLPKSPSEKAGVGEAALCSCRRMDGGESTGPAAIGGRFAIKVRASSFLAVCCVEGL